MALHLPHPPHPVLHLWHPSHLPHLLHLVQKEFAHTKAQFEEYLRALEKTYTVPKVAEPK